MSAEPPKKKLRKVWTCIICSKIYNSESGIISHVRFRHSLVWHRSGRYTKVQEIGSGSVVTPGDNVSSIVDRPSMDDAICVAVCSPADVVPSNEQPKSSISADIGIAAPSFFDELDDVVPFNEGSRSSRTTGSDDVQPVSPAPIIPLGYTAETLADLLHFNRSSSVDELAHKLVAAADSSNAATSTDREILTLMLSVGAAAELRVATAIRSIQDVATSVPELSGESSHWIDALLRAIQQRPT